MLKIYNKRAISSHERFQNAVVVGAGCAIISVIVQLLIVRLVYMYSSLVFALEGYLMGLAIQKFGRGVQVKFSYLGAGLMLAVMLVCDLMILGGIRGILYYFLSDSFSSLWTIAYRIAAVYFAYNYSRI